MMRALLLFALWSQSFTKPVTKRSLWTCASDVVIFCPHIEPGDGRVEDCLLSHRKFISKSCLVGHQPSIPVPPECSYDSANWCPSDDVSVLFIGCLERNMQRISQECVWKLKDVNPHILEMLPNRFRNVGVDSNCTKALIRACSFVPVGDGSLRRCVEQNSVRLAPHCGLPRKKEFDIIPSECRSDAMVLCKHTVKGGDTIRQCLLSALESAVDRTQVTPLCHAALRLQAVELNSECASDVVSFCPSHFTSRNDILACLHQHQARLAAGCRTREHILSAEERKNMGTRNLRTGESAVGCSEDIQKFCSGLPAGRGLIHRCLLQHRQELSKQCLVPRGQVVPLTPVLRNHPEPHYSYEEDVADRAAGSFNDTSENSEPKQSALANVISSGIANQNWTEISLALRAFDLDQTGDLDHIEVAVALSFARTASNEAQHHHSRHRHLPHGSAAARAFIRGADLDGNHVLTPSELESGLIALFGRGNSTLRNKNHGTGSSTRNSGFEFDDDGDLGNDARIANGILAIVFTGFQFWIIILVLLLVALGSICLCRAASRSSSNVVSSRFRRGGRATSFVANDRGLRRSQGPVTQAAQTERVDPKRGTSTTITRSHQPTQAGTPGSKGLSRPRVAATVQRR
mmetsp:Transcript_3854/g.11235  ORF Transcript_3854/g.11235 Transcript_3854/m.11235 type:complete len:632 (-) Transcript_3854:305-2200(-)